jgi:hypothetical protein
LGETTDLLRRTGVLGLLIGIGDRYDRIKTLDLGDEMPPEAIQILESYLLLTCSKRTPSRLSWLIKCGVAK